MTTNNIIEVIESKKKPQEAKNNSHWNQGDRVKIQGAVEIAVSKKIQTESVKQVNIEPVDNKQHP